MSKIHADKRERYHFSLSRFFEIVEVSKTRIKSLNAFPICFKMCVSTHCYFSIGTKVNYYQKQIYKKIKQFKMEQPFHKQTNK